ncbi:restriction endonuclease subunit S [Pantoea agglomerans]|jgi:type I restriction enzyme S subunit|uniref:restriction endonuclease subunit S n=1 Tax=Enterobacter agglomerans TaxID=549 RepID=UPI003811EFC1
MSGLNFLKKLLDGVDVEWMSLGDIGNFIRGNGLQKKDFVESGFPAIHYGQIYTRYGLSADKTFTYVSPELANKLRKAQKNDLLLATTSENDEDVVKPLAWLGDKTAISGDMMLFRHKQNVKYLAHFFQSEIFQTQKMKYITGAKVRRVSSGDLAKITIPIPCPNNPEKSLAIQSEIVRVLDKFTAITAELTAELTVRKKQYVYYRDQLLSFEEDEIELKALDHVCALISAGGDVPENSIKGQVKPTNEYPYPIYANATDEKGLYGYTDSYKIDSDAVTISARGAKVGYHTVRDAKFTPIIRLIVLVADKNLVRTRYLNYVLDMTAIGGTDGGIPQLTVPMVKKITVPIPFASDPNRSLAEQDRIVAVLDKFDTLTNSISEGLPREIELRQKQYEYYRDLLFSFPKSNIQEGA